MILSPLVLLIIMTVHIMQLRVISTNLKNEPIITAQHSDIGRI